MVDYSSNGCSALKVSAKNKVASSESGAHNTDYYWVRSLKLIQLCQPDMCYLGDF